MRRTAARARTDLTGLSASGAAAWIGPGAAFLTCALLSAPLSTLVHELGHALAARLAGLKVARVTVGAGPTVLRLRLAGLPVEFGRAVLRGGGATWLERPARVSRARTALMLLGGPAANLVLAAAAAGPVLRAEHAIALAAGLGLVASQLAFAADALWPGPARLGRAALPSDGRALLGLFARPE